MSTKVCKGPCGKEKSILEFSIRREDTLKDGTKITRYKGKCKDCTRIISREWRRANCERLNRKDRLKYHKERPKRLKARRSLYRIIDILLKAIDIIDDDQKLPEDILLHVREERMRSQTRARNRIQKHADIKKIKDKEWEEAHKIERKTAKQTREANKTEKERKLKQEKHEAYLRENPEIYERMRQNSKLSKENLEDSYIIDLLRNKKSSIGPIDDISNELINEKRAQLKLKRVLSEKTGKHINSYQR